MRWPIAYARAVTVLMSLEIVLIIPVELKTQTIVEHFLPAWPAPLLLAIQARHQADNKQRR